MQEKIIDKMRQLKKNLEINLSSGLFLFAIHQNKMNRDVETVETIVAPIVK